MRCSSFAFFLSRMDEKPKPKLLDPPGASFLEATSGFPLTLGDCTCLQVSMSLSDVILIVREYEKFLKNANKLIKSQ